ncbi:MAG: phenylalanine--tRNA ligase subunit beta [Cellvibrionaceae bacterium]|nr:phenylalanine--tRNA ligase subunit beta [Cellvibrionaceae bacterium]
MKLSETWLHEWVAPNLNTQKLAEQLTMAGLEVDAIEPVAGKFSQVVVGEITACEPHPDAEKLQVCSVLGAPDGPKQVVCGAPNARVGLKAPFALVGASLPPAQSDGKAVKIKKAKLRGVESLGMLCGQSELQAGDDDSGLWELPADAPVGDDIREYLKLDDQLLELDLTPNRSDCLSIRGLARETAALTRQGLRSPEIEPVAPQTDASLPIQLAAPAACPRYLGRVIKGVDISKPSPFWLREKLRRAGLRSIDAVVDVTNYVLIELGQPMHAFDLDKLKGQIGPRMAQAGEKITLLDGQELSLKPDTLVIADAVGPVALAGIMGGANSAVSESTRDIFLESAFFAPEFIAGKARAYGLHTDSSHRFERGVDCQLQGEAVERATALLVQIVGGEPGPVSVFEDDQHLPAQRSVRLMREQIKSKLGFAIADDEVQDILQRLGMSMLEQQRDSWVFAVPSYRFDIAIAEDLLEELARVYGYNRLPIATVNIPAQLPRCSDAALSFRHLANHLAARDYREVITYSFIDPKLHRSVWAEAPAVTVVNPISADMSLMRTSLFAGLLQTLQRNLSRQVERLRIFEKGLRFSQEGETYRQTPGLAGLIYGSRESAGWSAIKDNVDFYDIKGDVESLLALTCKTLRFIPADCQALHPGQSANIELDGQVVGLLGALHPRVQKSLGIAKVVYLFEIDLDPILRTQPPMFKPLSRFPEVSRDLAFLVDKNTPVNHLEREIYNSAGDFLKSLRVFDLYSGKGIDPQRKSVAFNLTFQHPSHTLNDDQVNNSVADIVEKLKELFDAQLR